LNAYQSAIGVIILNKKTKLLVIAVVVLGIIAFGTSMLWQQNHLNISKEKAAEIVFTDLSKQYGDVLEEKHISEVQWTAVKDAYRQRIVWIVTMDKFTRTDFPLLIQGSWGVVYRVDILTGHILERAYYE
jgi:hypothetical protein